MSFEKKGKKKKEINIPFYPPQEDAERKKATLLGTPTFNLMQSNDK